MAGKLWHAFGQQGTFVYYKRLATDALVNPSLGGLYKHSLGQLEMSSILGKVKNKDISRSLRAQASAELNKELTALQNAWGVSFPASVVNGQYFYDELIRAINTQIQTNAVYQRNKDRLEYTNKQGKRNALAKIDATQFFGTYFGKQWKANYKQIQAELTSNMTGDNLVQLVESILNNWLPTLLNNALIDMMSSQAFDARWNTPEAIAGNQRWEQDTAYRDMVAQLQKYGADMQNNQILQQVWKTYNFDGLLDALTKSITASAKAETSTKDLSKALSKQVSKVVGRASTAGNLAEIIWSQLVASVNNGPDFSIVHTGARNQQKADFMIFFRANAQDFLNKQSEIITEQKANDEESVRIQNIIATNGASQFLASNSVGYNFIAYVNAKNYTLNDSFSGFSAGSAMGMGDIERMLNMIPGVSQNGVWSLISSLIQFGDGAIGAGTGMEQDLMNQMSEVIANFLFDDYATLCSDINGSTSSSIHLFALDGIYIPLSFFLNISADAIDIGWEEAQDYFNFELHTVPILYGDLTLDEYTPEMWETQRADALARTKISMSFLKSFQTLIGSLI